MRKWVFDFCKTLVASMMLVVCMVLSVIGFVSGYIAGRICTVAYTIDSDVAKWFTNWLFELIGRITGYDLEFIEDEII